MIFYELTKREWTRSWILLRWLIYPGRLSTSKPAVCLLQVIRRKNYVHLLIHALGTDNKQECKLTIKSVSGETPISNVIPWFLYPSQIKLWLLLARWRCFEDLLKLSPRCCGYRWSLVWQSHILLVWQTKPSRGYACLQRKVLSIRRKESDCYLSW